MKFLIQRVSKADVKVENKTVGEINKGIVVLIGIGGEDTKQKADEMIRKLINLRIFEDENEKMNLSIKDVNGELLMISQFTLYADCKEGNRPSFTKAAKPEKANELYEYFCNECKKNDIKVEKGIFGANMQVTLLNDGPVTITIKKD